MSDLALLLGTLALLLGLTRVFGSLVTRIGQPAVVGEIIFGLLLGLTLSAAGIRTFPARLDSTVDTIAQVGLVLFLFCIGARLAPLLTLRRMTAAVVPALGAAVVPFGLGVLLAWWLAARHAPAGTAAFVLFAGAAMAITAFPVLARILAERGMLVDSDGQRALSAAALSDVCAYIALALVAGSLHGGSRIWSLVLIVPILLSIAVLAHPWFGRVAARLTGPAAATLMVTIACAGGAATEMAGLHSAIGAFLTGLAVGRSSAAILPAELVVPTASLFVPLYFVMVGRRVDLSRFDAPLVLEAAAVVAVAVLGKFGGSYLGARIARQPPRPAAVFAALMNTRGITELVFVSIGLSLGVIDGAFYTAMVAMALITTAMTGPLLNRLGHPARAARERGAVK
ncbi:cation:proton antiporter [Amycolatopsis anabasis]|uniref:cation:proton antiporter n=1 Tax=Amycolatopsis anabasis TaxID=1840409 RepID=UPI00131C04DF|nr:cation:proton antiporter [Amycolatopsis anabasis]